MASSVLEMSFTSEEQAEILRTILRYEATMRGLTMGQAFAELVLRGVDEGRYPDDVLMCLQGLREDARERAVGEAMAAVSLGEERTEPPSLCAG